jgi:hypothetical protein
MSSRESPNAWRSPPSPQRGLGRGLAIKLEPEQRRDEQEVEHTDCALALELRELLVHPALEVRVALEADRDQLNRPIA